MAGWTARVADLLPRALAVVVGLGLLLACGRGLDLARRLPADRAEVLRAVLQLVVLALAWLLVNSPVEGPVLWAPSVRHGLTVADLLAAPPLLLAVVLPLLQGRG
jgi:hypothetical protein